jgi:acyl carrier protein
MAVPSVEDIIDVIIDLIASDTHRHSAELRRELEALGPELPVDSLLAVEVLARVEEQFDVHVPPTVESSRNMRSVRRFAQAVHELAVAAERQAGASA